MGISLNATASQHLGVSWVSLWAKNKSSYYSLAGNRIKKLIQDYLGKKESEKADFKLNRIVASSPITSWLEDREKMERETDLFS